MMKTLLLKQKGVTLIELLIVVLLIGVLAAIAIPRVGNSSARARRLACQRNLDTINSAIELHRHENDAYPANLQVVTQNTNRFPDGEPICPITENPYPVGLAGNRVDATGHAH